MSRFPPFENRKGWGSLSWDGAKGGPARPIVSSKKGGSLDIPGSKGVRILPWAEVHEIVDRFGPLNPYDRKAVKGSILNLVDANFIDSDPEQSQRQLYGYSIAAKRYALYEKTGKSDIKIVDPKAHGVGFLYPPKDSPKDWDEEIPQWIYELWDHIVRRAFGAEMQKADLGRCSANDEAECHYLQRFENARKVGNCSSI